MGEIQRGPVDWDVPQFIDDTTGTERRSEAEAEDITKWEHIYRTYEDCRWYYIVFAPYDKSYKADTEWFNNYAVDKARKWAHTKGECFYVTKEVEATKVHSNLLICSKNDLTRYHGKSAYNRYRLNVSELDTQGDRRRVLAYITKEATKRTFKLYQDYYYTK